MTTTTTSAPATAPIEIRPLGHPGDLGWVVMAHGELYAAGTDPGPAAAWIAERARRPADADGERGPERVGCVFCVPGDDPEVAVLRILLVDPSARGHALGHRLVQTALQFARDAGYRRMRLWTNDPLRAARRVYLRHGFKLVEHAPHHSFGVDLVGQVYERAL